MDQVSRPALVALVAVLGFAGVWFTMLRPKAEPSASSAPAPVTATATPAPAASKPAEAPAKPVPAPAPAARVPTAAAADPSAPILRELAQGKTAVLLFWNARGADDRAAREAVNGADRHGGRVTVRVADIDNVAKYEAITRGVEVLQAPTALVIGPDRKARTIVGYTEAREIDQLVGDVRSAK